MNVIQQPKSLSLNLLRVSELRINLGGLCRIFLTTVIAACLLTGCNNKRIIQTVDDSADYKSAKTLPPLIKPSGAPANEPVLDDEPEMPADVVVAAPEKAPELVVEQTPELQEPVAVPATRTLTARVTEMRGGRSKLVIDAPFSEAWTYLAANLQKSDITIFTRNESAGLFSIGCADIPQESVRVEKRGGWSIFTRDNKEPSEYCGLQTTQDKDQTVVTVLNRAGVVVPAASSNKIFARILNNL
jgi:uncharacterized lipoprotein